MWYILWVFWRKLAFVVLGFYLKKQIPCFLVNLLNCSGSLVAVLLLSSIIALLIRLLPNFTYLNKLGHFLDWVLQYIMDNRQWSKIMHCFLISFLVIALFSYLLVWNHHFPICPLNHGPVWEDDKEQPLEQGHSAWTQVSQLSTVSETVLSITTVRCCYNVVNFLQYPYNWHPIAHPWGWGMGCLLWV